MNYSKVSNFPLIYSDVFISLGDTCKPALWLKIAKLRKQAMPLDWMRYYKLNVVIDMLKNKEIDYFSDFTETLVENDLHRHIRCNKTQIECIHHFPLECSAEEYLPIFKEMFKRRIKRFNTIVKKSKNVCFVMSRTDNILEIINFMQELANIYPDKQFTLINIRKNIENTEIHKYRLSKKVILYDYYYNDVHKNGDDPIKNKEAWKGNIKFWRNLVKKFHLGKMPVKKSIEQKDKYF